MDYIVNDLCHALIQKAMVNCSINYNYIGNHKQPSKAEVDKLIQDVQLLSYLTLKVIHW